MTIDLAPPINLRFRLGLLAVLLIPIGLQSELAWAIRLLSCLLPILLTGTYQRSQIDGKWIKTWFHAGFVCISTQRCKVAAVAYLDTRYQDSSQSMMLVFAPIQWLFGWLFDFLLPAIGGPFEIWIVPVKAPEFLVWRGWSDPHFEKTLALLVERTGVEVRVR